MDSTNGKTKDRICPNCGSNEIYPDIVAGAMISWSCRACSSTFPSAIEIYETAEEKGPDPKQAGGKTVSTVCPFCGSNDLFISSRPSVQSVVNPLFAYGGPNPRPAYECRGCGRVFDTPIEVFKTD